MIRTLITFLLCLLVIPATYIDDSKGKQQKFFPKELKKKGVYLGMDLKKFQKKAENATQIEGYSEFKIEYVEQVTDAFIQSYSYLFTQSNDPQLYAITIEYISMEGVQSRAHKLMGTPNEYGEWRMQPSEIKEDFTMGAWTFGHKIVYGATLIASEWEEGFQSR